MKTKSMLPMFTLAALLLATGNLLTATARAQNTLITYQGRVTDQGVDFNGTGQFQFALVTGANANSQAVGMVTNLSGGFVVGYGVTAGGSGYVTAPVMRGRIGWRGWKGVWFPRTGLMLPLSSSILFGF